MHKNIKTDIHRKQPCNIKRNVSNVSEQVSASSIYLCFRRQSEFGCFYSVKMKRRMFDSDNFVKL